MAVQGTASTPKNDPSMLHKTRDSGCEVNMKLHATMAWQVVTILAVFNIGKTSVILCVGAR